MKSIQQKRCLKVCKTKKAKILVRRHWEERWNVPVLDNKQRYSRQAQYHPIFAKILPLLCQCDTEIISFTQLGQHFKYSHNCITKWSNSPEFKKAIKKCEIILRKRKQDLLINRLPPKAKALAETFWHPEWNDDPPIELNGESVFNIYHPVFAKILPYLFEGGRSRTSVQADFFITQEAFRQWTIKYPEFGEAYEIGKTISAAWWEKHGREGTFIPDKKCNAQLFSLFMRNYFDWKSPSAPHEESQEDIKPRKIQISVITKEDLSKNES